MMFLLQRSSSPLSSHSTISVLLDQGKVLPSKVGVQATTPSRSCSVPPQLFHLKTGARI